MTITGISLSGLQASMARMTASASNIANVQAVGAISGSTSNGRGPYQPVRVRQSDVAGGGVSSHIVPVEPAQVPVYDPSARMADPHGMVAAPNVDIVDEIVEQLSARLAFEANAKVMGTVNDLERRSFEMWA